MKAKKPNKTSAFVKVFILLLKQSNKK